MKVNVNGVEVDAANNTNTFPTRLPAVRREIRRQQASGLRSVPVRLENGTLIYVGW